MPQIQKEAKKTPDIVEFRDGEYLEQSSDPAAISRGNRCMETQCSPFSGKLFSCSSSRDTCVIMDDASI